MAEKKIVVVEPDAPEQTGECCEPACGPTTCPPAAEAAEAKVEQPTVAEEPRKAPSNCEPSTCG